jgi:hypothetical protein
VIDSAHVTAEQVAARLALESFAGRDPSVHFRDPSVHFYATDSVAKFRGLGTRILGRGIESVELIDLGG